LEETNVRFRVPQPDTAAPNGTDPAPTPDHLSPLVAELAELRRRNEELAGQVGFWQGRYQGASEQLKLLQAPVASPPARAGRLSRLFRSKLRV
jgi:hypothetical protein